jgi:hypothetical protein
LRIAKIIFLSVFAGALLSGSAEGAEWKKYAENQHFTSYYRVEELNPLDQLTAIFSRKPVKVWTKRNIKSEKGRERQISENKRSGFSTTGYEDYEYSLFLNEINCSEKTFRILSEADYTKEGNILAKSEMPYAVWKPIAPDSENELLHKTVCPEPFDILNPNSGK